MSNLRQIFADICRGYSAFTWRGKAVYLKHLNHFDQVDLDAWRDRHLQIAEARGLCREKDRLTLLAKKGLWTPKKESEMARWSVFCENMEKTIKTILPSQKKESQKQLDDAKKRVKDLQNEKEGLIGLTCEKYADQKLYNFYLFVSLHKDKNLEEKLFTLEEFEGLYDSEISELFYLFSGISDDYCELNLKKIAVSSFFTFYFKACQDRCDIFYKKPVIELSFYQLNLFYYAKYYQTLLENMENIPQDVAEDPVKLEERFNLAQKAKTILSSRKNNSGEREFVGIVGTREDVESMGLKMSEDKSGGREIHSIQEAIDYT